MRHTRLLKKRRKSVQMSRNQLKCGQSDPLSTTAHSRKILNSMKINMGNAHILPMVK